MSEQYALFGEHLKSHGMRKAAEAAPDLLSEARDVAAAIARERGTVTIDDVRAQMGIGPGKQNGANWLGSVFRDARFAWTGQFVKARLSTSHSRMVRVWRLK